MNSSWRRLHPIALVAALIDSVKTAGALMLTMLAIALPSRDSAVVMAVVGVVIAILAIWMLMNPIVRWMNVAYCLDDNGITQRSGVFNRKRTTISYEHIHTMSSSSPIYMRPFQAVILDITAAGGESGITLKGVPASVQLELEAARRHNDSKADVIPEQEQRPVVEGELVFRASVRDILLFAITDLGLFAAAIAVYGFVGQLRDLIPETIYDHAQDSVIRFISSGAVVLVGVVLGVAVVLVGASMIGALLRFYGFEVWRRGGDVVVVRGAFTRRVTTIAVDRIQTVTIRHSLVRRALHLCSVRLGLGAVATAEGEDGDSTGADVLPVIGDDRVFAVLQRMLPEWQLEKPQLHHSGAGLARYYMLMPVVAAVAGMGAVAIWAMMSDKATVWWWMVAPCIVGVWWGVCRWLKSTSEGYALLDARRIVVGGASALTVFMIFTRRSRIQSVERATTPWRQRRGVERLTLPLFVSNGINSLRFTALRTRDADALAAWAE